MDIKEFPHPFDTPIIEKEEVEAMEPTVTLGDDGKVKEVNYEKVKRIRTTETTYHYAPAKPIACANMHHEWYMSDPGRYVVSCTKCTKNRILTPIRHKLVDGHICDRDNGRILD